MRLALACLALGGLAACDGFDPFRAAAPPTETARAAPIMPPQPSSQSQALADYYQRVEAGLLVQGLLRTDGGGPDTPYTEANLIENFVRIALYEEYVAVGGRLIPRQTESRLHRWEKPIAMTVRFGASVPQEARDRDRQSIGSFAARLARVTDHPIRLVRRDANFHVYIVNDDELRQMGPELRTILPGISDSSIATVTDLPRTSYCLVFASDNGAGSYDRAVAIIRAEHPDLLRLSCIHEELAQGMGLANDSPAARPSIFNDDEEFGLLTRHDELLLKILYDPRLRPGMKEAEARPIVAAIATELVGGPS
jgi:hypothetical protein